MTRPIKSFTDQEVSEVKDLYLITDLNKVEIAKKLGVSYSRVNKLIKDLELPKKPTKSKGVATPSRRVYVDLERVRNLREELYSYEQIAGILEVSEYSIKRCIDESDTYVDCSLHPHKKLAGRVSQVIDKYYETLSVIKTAEYFDVTTKVISKLLKYKGVEIDLATNIRANNNKLTHGKSRTYIYNTWKGIKQRCLNSKNSGYHNYGGRGINIHPEWVNNFEAFYHYIHEYLGSRPTPQHSIDRYPDNNGGYVPGNIRWATKSQQARNTRRNRITEEIAQQLRDAHISIRPPGAPSVKQLARQYDLDYSTAKKISRGEYWN
ncbi:MAG: hypothetical protein AAGE84_14055 [Cyanobacteria bacterium P01_G01_bin.39]